jgi:hypothetical protein
VVTSPWLAQRCSAALLCELFTASHFPPVERAGRAWYHARADLAGFAPIVDGFVRIVTPYVMF